MSWPGILNHRNGSSSDTRRSFQLPPPQRPPPPARPARQHRARSLEVPPAQRAPPPAVLRPQNLLPRALRSTILFWDGVQRPLRRPLQAVPPQRPPRNLPSLHPKELFLYLHSIRIIQITMPKKQGTATPEPFGIQNMDSPNGGCMMPEKEIHIYWSTSLCFVGMMRTEHPSKDSMHRGPTMDRTLSICCTQNMPAPTHV